MWPGTYYQEGGSVDFFHAEGNREKLETVAGVILALQDRDGLTWAKDNWRVKYLMDNSEVYWGLKSMANLEKEVFDDNKAARKYERAAKKVRNGIRKSLFNRRAGLYRVAKFDNGSYQEADLNSWYPGTVALAWPHLFGVIKGKSKTAQNQMEAINANWDWTSQSSDGSPWASIGQAALVAGDQAGASRQANLILEEFADFHYPFTVDDAGFLISTLSQLDR